MIEKIGKYKIIQDNNMTKVFYLFSFSDAIGMLLPFIGFIFGCLFSYAIFKDFTLKSLLTIPFWILFIAGTWFIIFFIYKLISIFYCGIIKPLLIIDKLFKKIIIREGIISLKYVEFKEIKSIYCDIVEVRERNYYSKHGILKFGLENNERLDSLIINSKIPIDLGRKVDKDIMDTADKLKNLIYDQIEMHNKKV